MLCHWVTIQRIFPSSNFHLIFFALLAQRMQILMASLIFYALYCFQFVLSLLLMLVDIIFAHCIFHWFYILLHRQTLMTRSLFAKYSIIPHPYRDDGTEGKQK